jgi:uncharacterized protein YndB with AHSA1/START domain
VVIASRDIAADPAPIFELIADPAQQPRWDGNDNLARAPEGQRVRRTGDVVARAPVAMGARASRRGGHAGHAHLRLDAAH